MLHMLPLSLLIALPLFPVWAAPYCSITSPSASVPSPSSVAAASSASGGDTTSSSATSSGNTSVAGDDIVISAWYAGWHGEDFPPENVSWSKYTAMTYSFAVTTPDVTVISLADSDEELIPRFVSSAHQNSVKAMITVGGWSGSQYFSTAVATEANRTAFVQTVLGLVSQYGFDGLDFDWEYPGKQGMGCNTISSSDSANFLLFLQALRNDPAGQNLTLSAAASLTPFAGSDGNPMSDVSDFAKVLDYVAIMNYDVWGSWSPGVGPNAPLNDTCAPASAQRGSAVSAVEAWTSAGFPANQLVLGVPSYGHSFHVTPSDAGVSSGVLVSYPPFDAALQPVGDSWDPAAPAGVDQCGNPFPAGSGGTFELWGLVQGGFLTDNGTVADGMDYRYDECSQTPYIYNPNTEVMVSYDNAQSFAAKGNFVNQAGLRGFAMYEAGGDYNDILLDSITSAAGIVQVGCD